MGVSDNKRGSFHQVSLVAGRKWAQGTVISKCMVHFLQHHGGGAEAQSLLIGKISLVNLQGSVGAYIFAIPGRGVQHDLQASGSGGSG